MNFYATRSVGVVFAIGGYAVTQLRIISSDDWRFPASSLAGCTLIGVSLSDKWNLPSFLLQVAYGAISLYGLFRCWRDA